MIRVRILKRGVISMNKEKIQLTDDLLIETYPFSDYITCVEVFLKGESFNAFCSDNSVVDEWKENPDMLIELCNDHLLHQPKKTTLVVNDDHNHRQALGEGIELETYSFSEDIYCINVYQHGKMVNSFCSDRSSIDEMEDDPEVLRSIIKKMLKIH
jgi:hypothetical protein